MDVKDPTVPFVKDTVGFVSWGVGGRGLEGQSPLAAMLAIVIGNQVCAAFLYMTLSMLGCHLLN